VVFTDANFMIRPGVEHLGQIAIIPSHPAIKNASNNFYKEKYDELGIAQAGTGKKFRLRNQPGKQYKIRNKKKVFQEWVCLALQNK
jgi:hypothetical protein